MSEAQGSGTLQISCRGLCSHDGTYIWHGGHRGGCPWPFLPGRAGQPHRLVHAGSGPRGAHRTSMGRNPEPRASSLVHTGSGPGSVPRTLMGRDPEPRASSMQARVPGAPTGPRWATRASKVPLLGISRVGNKSEMLPLLRKPRVRFTQVRESLRPPLCSFIRSFIHLPCLLAECVFCRIVHLSALAAQLKCPL